MSVAVAAVALKRSPVTKKQMLMFEEGRCWWKWSGPCLFVKAALLNKSCSHSLQFGRKFSQP